MGRKEEEGSRGIDVVLNTFAEEVTYNTTTATIEVGRMPDADADADTRSCPSIIVFDGYKL